MRGVDDTLTAPADAGVEKAGAAAVAVDDDMVDTPADLERWPLLRGPLQTCRDVLGGPYTTADRAAMAHQRDHRILTLIAAACGTAAVLVAVLQMSESLGETPLRLVEMVAAAIALIAVALGVFAARQRNWLLQRHRAEHCRLLKFHYLTDPALWSDRPPDPAAQAASLREVVATAEAQGPAELERWVHEDEVPEVPSLPPGAVVAPDALRQLVEYYRERRLGVQRAFFARRAKGNVRVDTYTRRLGPFLFFASVVCAFAHFVYDLSFAKDHHPDAFSRGLIFLAAGLPVLGAGIRTWRSANEFGRNKVRYRAKQVALQRMAERLETETNPEAIFRDFWCCEQVLESEHREWLRLMMDAEWF